MGHEFTGTVVQVGASVANFRIGDFVVSPFTTSWSVPFMTIEVFI
jgi:threonine dehydrogenase-like Zn-dependent dehydrogenase